MLTCSTLPSSALGGTDKLGCVQLCSELFPAVEGWGNQGTLWPTQALQPLQLHLDFYQTGKWASSWKVDAFTRHNIVHGQEVKSQSHICTCCSFLCWDKRKERRNWIPACYVFPKVSSSCFKQIGIVTFFKSQVFSQECEKPGFCLSPCQWENCITTSFLSKELNFCNGITHEGLLSLLAPILLYSFL